MSSKFKQYLLPVFLFVVFVLLYTHNASRSIYGGDVGDLVTAAKVMGVAHPSGYPLFTLLGFLLTRINFLTPAFMVGLVSVFSASLSIVIYYFISLKIAKSKLIAFISSLVLGFNYIFWFYAEIAEVFSLNTLFVLGLFFLALLVREKKDINYLYILAFFTGLSLTNHLTIVLFFPSILILIYDKLWLLIKNPKRLLIAGFFFLTGFSVYLYVFIASSHNPPVNWENVKDLDSFLRLILRKGYGTFSAGSFTPALLSQRLITLKVYSLELLTQLTIPVVILIFLGLIYSFKKNKRIFLSALIGFIISGPLFIGYAGFPLASSFLLGVNERFTLMSCVIALIFLPFGILLYKNIFNTLFKKNSFEKLFLIVLLIVPLSLFYYNFPKTDLSKITIGDDFAYDYLTPLEKNALFLVAGDTALLNTWYVHYALNFRPDVTVLNLNTLRGNAYYETKRDEYLKKFPKNISDPDLKLRIFEHMLVSRPIFSTDAIKPVGKYDGIKWMPYGLTKKMLLKSEDYPSEDEFVSLTTNLWGNSRYYKNLLKVKKSLALGNLTISEIPQSYSDALLYTGNFILSQYKDNALAEAFFKNAISTSPGYYKSYEAIGVYYLGLGNCKKAEENFQKVNSLYPFDKTNYYLLYITNSRCFNNNSEKLKIIKDYKNIFSTDFEKDFYSNFISK